MIMNTMKMKRRIRKRTMRDAVAVANGRGWRAVVTVLAIALLSLTGPPAFARERVHVVGSSTIYPFATVVAEYLGRSPRYEVPLVESTGSGGGLKLFCAGVGLNTPDVTNASRRIKSSEFALCQKNGVKEILEVKIGYDGIVLARSRAAKRFELGVRDIYLALAKDVPSPKGGEKFVPNPYRRWKDVKPGLPDIPIRVLGPPPTSGTRDAFVELAMEGGCKQFAFISALKKKDRSAYKARCHAIREDGAWIEAGENDNLIVQKLIADANAVGIFGYSFLQSNKTQLQGAIVDGYSPTLKHIAAADYPIARSLYFYVKLAHLENISGIDAYVEQFVSPRAVGPGGYLVERGLIPLPDAEQKAVRRAVEKKSLLSM